MNFTVEVHDAARLSQVLSQVQRIGGVRRAARR
jgi:GTP pyrophosphokinase